MTAAEIRRRFIAREPGPDRGAVASRGDHELNPGMLPLEEPRAAAVLVPLVDRAPELTILLTQRTQHLARHAGQIAFPGGRVEEGDADVVAAALRETEEEIGLDRRHIEPLGQLDRYITRTGFTVTPVVGIVSPPFELKLDPREVADSFEVPLSFILDPANRQRHSAEYQGVARYFYAFPYGERYIWGATAGMLVNLAELLAN
ncbi:MAG TPA: CoA pyrophosphatase [Alphaproteobacteria bacterium]|nr:CoA pyrophosphatase [Alphaproteobacteria bacterium]